MCAVGVYACLKHGDADVCIASYEKMSKTSFCCENSKSHRHDVTLCVHTSCWSCHLRCTESFPASVLYGKIDSLLSPLSSWGSESTEKFIVHSLIAEINRDRIHTHDSEILNLKTLFCSVQWPTPGGWRDLYKNTHLCWLSVGWQVIVLFCSYAFYSLSLFLQCALSGVFSISLGTYLLQNGGWVATVRVFLLVLCCLFPLIEAWDIVSSSLFCVYLCWA